MIILLVVMMMVVVMTMMIVVDDDDSGNEVGTGTGTDVNNTDVVDDDDTHASTAEMISLLVTLN